MGLGLGEWIWTRRQRRATRRQRRARPNSEFTNFRTLKQHKSGQPLNFYVIPSEFHMYEYTKVEQCDWLDIIL